MHGKNKKNFILFILFGILVCLTDYPHFIYIVFLSNIYYFYKFFRKQKILQFGDWVKTQMVLFITFLPMLWLLYQRIFIQGDGGFTKLDLLGGSILSLSMKFFIHFYVYFFGENILPWSLNWFPFIFGLIVMVFVLFFIIKYSLRKKYPQELYFILYLFLGLVVSNTLFMNYADPRYNFIVYPKYVFVAFPIFIILLSYLIFAIKNYVLKYFLILFVVLIQIYGLYNFYSIDNYLNASYFNTFKSFDFVKDNLLEGDYVIISGDLNQGAYDFYKDRYFIVRYGHYIFK